MGPLHRLEPQHKILALTGFVAAVVATPAGAWWAFGVHATIVAVAALISRVRLRTLLARMVIEVPFLVFAVLLPFVASGPTLAVGPLSISTAGLHASALLVIKGTLGVAAAVLLGATTPARDLVVGLERLRLPRQLVAILGFMVRYVDVVTGELRRMRIARASRGFESRSLRSWPVVAAGAGALFIRSYERGERVHLAMLSRGYAGRYLTDIGPGRGLGDGRGAVVAGAPVALAWIVALAAVLGGAT